MFLVFLVSTVGEGETRGVQLVAIFKMLLDASKSYKLELL